MHAPRWFIRPNNTDWRYTRFLLPRIKDYSDDIEFINAQSFVTAAKFNLRYALGALRYRLRLPRRATVGVGLNRQEFRKSKCDAVFCHDDFPSDADGISVVWQNSILDPQMMSANGASSEQLEKFTAEKRHGFEAATLVQVSSEAEKIRLSRTFSNCADKFVTVPFFLPDARRISSGDLEVKLKRVGPLRCLFVGNDARRKGLARVYEAFKALGSDVRLTVVSTLADGNIIPPAHKNVVFFKGLPHADVITLMRESDVLLMPSSFESYGLVFLEAMSQGTIPVVPDWEVQREIVGYGSAGVITNGTPQALVECIQRLCDDHVWRLRLSTEACNRFEKHYAPKAVAGAFREAMKRLPRS